MEDSCLASDQKKARRLNAHLVFPDESGFQLIPTVRRTWAPRTQTPIIRHRDRRDKVSAISALTVSPRRQRLGLYMHVHPQNLTTDEVAIFLRQLLRHLRGPVIVVWDQGKIHKGPAVRALQQRCRRLHLYEFPAYAPELNPDEAVWAYAKRSLANGRPLTLDALFDDVIDLGRRLHRRPDLLAAFFKASDLPPFLRR